MQQTYSCVTAPTCKNVTTKYTAKQYNFLRGQEKFAAKERGLLAELSGAQRRGALPSSHRGLAQILGNQYPGIFTISSHFN